MLDRNPSRTAEATAAIRACHLRYDSPLVFADPYAAQLTSPWWRAVANNPVFYWSIVRGLLGALRPVHGWILVRDQLTVDDLRVFVANGGRQYVSLGAGFDSIALRRPEWLRGVRIVLTAAAIADTLGHIAARAAPGSELVFDFLLPEFAVQRGRRRVWSLAGAMTTRMGERYISYHAPEYEEGLFQLF